MTYTDREQDVFEVAYEELVKELPQSVARAMARLRAPNMKWVRIGTGVLFLVGGALSFLPVLGLELLPLGLLFLAHDVSVLRRPAARLLLWLVTRWRELKRRFGWGPATGQDAASAA